ncbi:MAG: hypothetical protein H6Q68_3673 [Firmicutes bacterium]|nr:hypothetical protein [Bacillota bacterium]
MGEFQINITNRSSDFIQMFNNPSQELRISCDFKFSQEEINYMSTHCEELLGGKIWITILPEAYRWGGSRMAMFAAQFRNKDPEVSERIKLEKPMLLSELTQLFIRGEFFVLPVNHPTCQG